MICRYIRLRIKWGKFMRTRTFARECGMKILYQIEILKENPEEIIDRYWVDNDVTDEDVRNFSTILITGVLKECKLLDKVIMKHTDNWDLSRMAILDKSILRLGVYELLYLDDIPPKVSINEAVNLAKKFSQEDSGKFVNGILDHINHNE